MPQSGLAWFLMGVGWQDLVLHVVCELILGQQRHAAEYSLTDKVADCASVSAASALCALHFWQEYGGQKRRREIFFVGRNYSAQDALDWNGKCCIPLRLGKYAYEWGRNLKCPLP